LDKVEENLEIWKKEEIQIINCKNQNPIDKDTIKEFSSRMFNFTNEIERDNTSRIRKKFIQIRREVKQWSKNIFTFINEEASWQIIRMKLKKL
jgi:hypothetical protein